MTYILVGLGGALGSLARYGLGKFLSVRTGTAYPYSTFLINITGAFILGVLNTLKMEQHLYLLFADGFLGAYTTFSTFMYEGFELFRDNTAMNAGIYIISSLMTGILAYYAGYRLFI